MMTCSQQRQQCHAQQHTHHPPKHDAAVLTLLLGQLEVLGLLQESVLDGGGDGAGASDLLFVCLGGEGGWEYTRP